MPSDLPLVTSDPAWPWSLPSVGLPAFVLLAVALTVLTVWTYTGVRRASSRRVALLLGLRLAALVVACLLVLRPSFAFRDELRVPSTLLIAMDDSQSMTIQDQHNNQSRWDYLRRLLHDAQPELERLRDERNVSVVLYRFAADVRDFEPDGKAEGKRTDFGELLQALYERHGSERSLRGLLILSDGADNGTRYPALGLAGRWRSLPCPIHTFAFGQTTTSAEQHDIAFTAINPDPPTVATKGRLTVRGTVDAPGFENSPVRVHLLINDKEVLASDAKLPRTTGNEVRMVCDAPAEPGEIKVTLKIDPLPGEVTRTNNEISTYVTVTKEGISVLYVEGKFRAWEPKFIRYALSQEPSIRLDEAVRLSDTPPPPTEADLYRFEKKRYDVILLGDVTAARLSAGDAAMLETINRLVADKGTGLMMLGGYESFGNSDWDNTPIARLLPVSLDATGQVEGPVRMVPTRQGLQHYVLRLSENAADNASLWAKLRPLDGMTRLGRPKAGAFVLAESTAGEPVLVGQQYGSGRTLAFAGDTTWRWRSKDEDGVRAHARFWRQVVLWLAKRDEAEGNILVLPDTRRLPAGGKLGFTVKLRGKGGVEVPPANAHFDVTVKGPGTPEAKVPTARERGEERGTFWKTDQPGEYVLTANGSGTDVDGKPLSNLPPGRVRFLVYQDEAEMARQAADHDFLTKLASLGGGAFHEADAFPQFLRELSTQPLPQSRAKARLWPDWRRNPPSATAGDQVRTLAGSGILACFVLFVLLLCLEWFLRRYWGFV
jgi:uncharacterized membrane protein